MRLRKGALCLRSVYLVPRHDGGRGIESCDLGITSTVGRIRSEGIIGGGQFHETFKWYPAQLCVRVMIWDLSTLHSRGGELMPELLAGAAVKLMSY